MGRTRVAFFVVLWESDMLIQELKRCCEGSGRSRYWVSQQTNGKVSQSELSRWHQGKLNLGAEKLDMVARAIGATVVLTKS